MTIQCPDCILNRWDPLQKSPTFNCVGCKKSFCIHFGTTVGIYFLCISCIDKIDKQKNAPHFNPEEESFLN